MRYKLTGEKAVVGGRQGVGGGRLCSPIAFVRAPSPPSSLSSPMLREVRVEFLRCVVGSGILRDGPGNSS